ncbi:PEP-CTERM sorting domain-containing protein [Coraliomargarita sp. SDUM461004]|uniref:PEP-CTERM sorting domain-containing protein n=1 Tax=Thalassobacterium sedimentorum TaxID=3041258 RepID=A0ABU1AEM6_9BACT|nr:PEP-CTERM sorting domain-containing protein [Coraliomargarita sp. SDUM461004]MDQ8192964.1 PEP-CTERM sorting domain-containing protein [Coraliomargarita sp. SDUM461004]
MTKKYLSLSPLTLKVGALLVTGIGLPCMVNSQTLPYSYDFEDLSPGNIAPTFLAGNLNEITGTGRQGNPYGWYGSAFGTNERVTISPDMNSPWDVGGSQSAALVDRNASSIAPSIYNYFTDRTGLTNNNPSSVDVDGSLGASLTGSGYTVAWDFYGADLNTQPHFAFYSSNGTEAFALDVRYSTHYLRYSDGSGSTQLVEYAMKDENWYRFEVVDIDIDNQTYGFNVYEWNGTSGTTVATVTDAAFANSVTDLDYFRLRVNTANTEPEYYLDNFSIIPEPSSTALLFGSFTCMLAIFMKRRRQ